MAPLPVRRLVAALSLSVLLFSPAGAALNSAQYKFEGNRWLSLDLAVGDVRTDVIRFDWPSAVLGIKTGYKATVKVVNASARQTSVGIVVAVYDGTGKLVGVGSSGTKIGTIDPGDSADFSIEFNNVTERLEQATQFQIALQTR
ncbi:MAG TPA: FxLYD domain-containing protein [Candidatus Polarisedimenticolia bacterium]|nr:FxLYD domain-containing protein [Candidatus Polarisedimenticolia bacterium]